MPPPKPPVPVVRLLVMVQFVIVSAPPTFQIPPTTPPLLPLTVLLVRFIVVPSLSMAPPSVPLF